MPEHVASPGRQQEQDLEYKYRVAGHDQLLPYSLAKKATPYPSTCAVHDAAGIPDVAALRRSNLCDRCVDQLRTDLRSIEERWDDLTEALHPARGGSDGERGGTDINAPLPIDWKVSEAMRAARSVVWSIVGQLLQDRPLVKMPADHSTGTLAGWLAKWHVEYLADHPSARHLVTCYTEIQQAASEVRHRAFRVQGATTALDSHCHQFTETDTGERAPCPGKVEGVLLPDGRKSVQCSHDPAHMIPMDKWLMIQGSARGGQASRPARSRNTLLKKYGATGPTRGQTRGCEVP